MMEPPVQVVIKAPNQRVEDHTVDCMLDWTVKKLKQHLTQVYPSQPSEKQQKLIYSGKLLQDHLTLKEVLRQFDDGSTKHTVHLVCSFSPQADPKKKEFESHSRRSSSGSDRSQSTTSRSETEGIRHRHVGGPQTLSPNTTTYQQVNNQGVFNPYSAYVNQMPIDPSQFTGAMPTEAAMFASMMPQQPGMPYSPEQYVWMQQMYAQYMAQYMQYYQQAGYPTPPNTPVTPAPGQPEAQANVQDNNNEAEFDDVDGDDGEFRQQDWLDYVYTFSRFMVLIGIVYFYSSLTRFLMVGAFFVFVYLYQRNWLLPRRNPQPREQPENQEPVNPQAENDSNQQEDTQNEDSDQGETTTDTTTDAPVEPAGPGFLQITGTFIMTFFTSLFPAPPPAVNMN